MNTICNIQDLNKKALYNLLFILPFLLLIVMFFFVTFRNGDVFTPYQKEWEYGLGGISLLLSYGFMRECWWLSRKLDNFNIQNYSNEDDFPYAFAKKVFRLPLIGFTIMWIVFLSESREVYMCVNILMAMFMVFFLCQILHPNKAIRSPLVKEELECMEKECLENIMRRNEDFKPENSASSETDEKVSSCQKVVLDVEGGIDKEALLKQMAEKDWEAVKKEVLTIVSRRYLEPSLKRVDLRSKYPDLTGKVAENALVAADITVNKNMVPFDSRSAFQTWLPVIRLWSVPSQRALSLLLSMARSIPWVSTT